MSYYLAIDIGASSGRHVVGWMEDGEIKTKEVYRFPNGNKRSEDGHLVWDIDRLFNSVVEGIGEAFLQFPEIESLSIDTWAVDYVLMNGDKEIYPCYAYRDSRTEAVIPKVHEKVSFSELYAHTGIQFQTFNTVYQLYEDLESGRLECATDYLMIPEYLMYKLCGVKAHEYTNATTTGLLSADTGEFDRELITELGLPNELFGDLLKPGTELGELLPEIARRVNGNCKVVFCATHDTASAVEGIPMEGNNLYISSGTWSLLGVKTAKPVTSDAARIANYSNEGGVDYNRFQKNIMGLWMVQCLQQELYPNDSFAIIAYEAEQSKITDKVDTNASEFLAPKSMKRAIETALGKTFSENADYCKCVFLSLADSYAKAIEELENIVGTKYDNLYIVGGGAKNNFLNKLTREATGKNVIALPIEATSIGNLKVQMEAQNEI